MSALMASVRSTRCGARAPGQTTSIMPQSMSDDWPWKVLCYCEKLSSLLVGRGTTWTSMPVSLVNCVARMVSISAPGPTASPQKTTFAPLYCLASAALGTGGGLLLVYWYALPPVVGEAPPLVGEAPPLVGDALPVVGEPPVPVVADAPVPVVAEAAGFVGLPVPVPVPVVAVVPAPVPVPLVAVFLSLLP